MKKRNNITAKICLFMLLLAFLAMIALPFQAWATDDDFDNDGILDIHEAVLGTDKNKADLFIRLLNPEDAPLPDNPFEFITKETEIFNINVHVINFEDAPGQVISPTQYAVDLTWDQRTTDGELGYSMVGVPAQKVSGRVYPYRIKEDVINACYKLNPDDCVCMDSDGAILADGIDEIVAFYQKNVLAHEIFHMLDRVRPVNKKVDYHYAQNDYIMDHHMTYKVSKKEGRVIWYITDKWAPADVPRFK